MELKLFNKAKACLMLSIVMAFSTMLWGCQTDEEMAASNAANGDSSSYSMESDTEKSTDAKVETEKETKTETTTNNSQNIEGMTGDMRNISAMELYKEMKVGWNLGNSLDSYANGASSETAWGNPAITKTLIDNVKAAGFNTIRIPVTYVGHVGQAPDYTVDSAWLDRVQQVVDYAMQNGMYVIINIHHDGNKVDDNGGAWIDITQDDQSQIQAKFGAMWTQISTRFKDYNEHLIFESMNELHDGTYQAPGANAQKYYGNVNALNQLFVDKVRATGGNNAVRCFLIPGYNTNVEYTIEGLKMPNDSVQNKIMISFHYYDPYQYALEQNYNCSNWGNGISGCPSWGNEDYADQQFAKMKTQYVDKGIPVIMGEYGASSKNNDASRRYYLEYITRAACKNGILPVYWDNGYNGEFGFALFDRNSGAQLHGDLISAIIRASQGNDYTVAKP